MYSWIMTTRNDNYGGNVDGVINATMKRLRITIESILKLPGQHEIIVVDFGSLGPVSAFLTDYPVKNIWVNPKAIELLQQESQNEKFSFYEYVAKDIGIKHSNGDYLIICNPDNIFPTKDFEMVERALKAGYIARAKRYEIDRSILQDDIAEIIQRGDTGEFCIIGEFASAAGDFTAISRNHYEKVGGYAMLHGNWHLDNELLERALAQGLHIAMIYKHYHINHDDAIDSPSKNKDWHEFKKIEPKTLEKVYELAQV